MSLAADYEGPYRCWQCRGLFTITVEDNRLADIQALSQETFEAWQEAERLRKKMNRD